LGILGKRKADQVDARQVDAFEIVAAQVVDVLATAGVVVDERNLVLPKTLGQHLELLNRSFRLKLASSESSFGFTLEPRSLGIVTSCCWLTTEPRQND
jgi:hypothetical protein